MKTRYKLIIIGLGLWIGAMVFSLTSYPDILGYGLPVTIIVALGCAVFGLGVAFAIWRADLRQRRKAMRPGEEKCPHCGSVQTDRVPDLSNSGAKSVEMTCFNCGAKWTSEIRLTL